MADFDESCPVFFDVHLDQDIEFYGDAPAPSQDIWKKFELLPTPPRSPKHDSFEKDEEQTTPPSPESCLELVSERLDTLKEQSSIQNFAPEFWGEQSSCYSDMQSNLIQDCMWSAAGIAAAGIQAGKAESLKKTNKTWTADSATVKLNSATLDTPAAVEIPSSECVDPIAVFPFPINEPRLLRRRPSCSDVPMTPSDSEEEEEIDVVTVEKNHKLHLHRRRRTVLPASTSMSAQVAAMHNYSHCGPAAIIVRSAPQSPAHHHSLKRQHPASSPGSPQPIIKRLRTGVNEAELRTAVQNLNNVKHGHNYSSSRGSSRASSDSEEGGECKRAQHNVLERKRRNDLKFNFLQLRDALPEVAKQDKAAKVVILKRAVEYINELHSKQRTLKKELEHQERMQQRLRERLGRFDFFN